MVFQSNIDTNFYPLDTIRELCLFTIKLLRLGLMEDRQHLLLLHAGLDFIDTVRQPRVIGAWLQGSLI